MFNNVVMWQVTERLFSPHLNISIRVDNIRSNIATTPEDWNSRVVVVAWKVAFPGEDYPALATISARSKQEAIIAIFRRELTGPGLAHRSGDRHRK